MKTITNTTRYQCGYCRKEYKVGAACQKHEVRCGKNPENHVACSSCVFLKETEKEIEIDNPYGYATVRKFKSFHCEKKNIGLFPPKVEHMGYNTSYPESFEDEERMPLKCNDFSYDVYF